MCDFFFFVFKIFFVGIKRRKNLVFNGVGDGLEVVVVGFWMDEVGEFFKGFDEFWFWF